MNKYIIVRFSGGKIELSGMMAKTAEQAIQIADIKAYMPERKILLNPIEEESYGDGNVAIRIDTLEDEQEIIAKLEDLFCGEATGKLN